MAEPASSSPPSSTAESVLVMAWVDIRRLQEDDSESHAPHDLDMVPLLRMDSLQDLRADVKKRVQTYICNSFQKELRLGVCVARLKRR